MGARHEQRRARALVGDVAEHQHQPVTDEETVDEIASDLIGRFEHDIDRDVRGPDRHAQRRGHQLELQPARFVEFGLTASQFVPQPRFCAAPVADVMEAHEARRLPLEDVAHRGDQRMERAAVGPAHRGLELDRGCTGPRGQDPREVLGGEMGGEVGLFVGVPIGKAEQAAEPRIGMLEAAVFLPDHRQRNRRPVQHEAELARTLLHQIVGMALRADIAVRHDQSAVGQRIAPAFNDAAVRQHAFSEVGGLGRVQVLADHGLDAFHSRAEVAALRLAANEALECRRARELGVGEFQKFSELPVPGPQPVGGVEYGDALIELVEHRLQCRQAGGRFGLRLAAFGAGRLPDLRPGTHGTSTRESYPVWPPASSISDTMVDRSSRGNALLNVLVHILGSEDHDRPDDRIEDQSDNNFHDIPPLPDDSGARKS